MTTKQDHAEKSGEQAGQAGLKRHFSIFDKDDSKKKKRKTKQQGFSKRIADKKNEIKEAKNNEPKGEKNFISRLKKK